MAGGFEYDLKDDGAAYVYPQGGRECAYSLKLPQGGYFFDALDRFEEVDEARINAKEDFGNDFGLFSDETARYLEERARSLYEHTDLGVVGNFGGAGFGDMGSLPGHFFEWKNLE